MFGFGRSCGLSRQRYTFINSLEYFGLCLVPPTISASSHYHVDVCCILAPAVHALIMLPWLCILPACFACATRLTLFIFRSYYSRHGTPRERLCNRYKPLQTVTTTGDPGEARSSRGGRRRCNLRRGELANEGKGREGKGTQGATLLQVLLASCTQRHGMAVGTVSVSR